jgi:hypothetical protein
MAKRVTKKVMRRNNLSRENLGRAGGFFIYELLLTGMRFVNRM